MKKPEAMNEGQLPTVAIVTEKTDDNPLGYIVINHKDFDPDEHKLFQGQIASSPAPAVGKEKDPEPVDFDKFTVAQLRDHLANKGVAIDSDARKADLVELAKANP